MGDHTGTESEAFSRKQFRSTQYLSISSSDTTEVVDEISLSERCQLLLTALRSSEVRPTDLFRTLRSTILKARDEIPLLGSSSVDVSGGSDEGGDVDRHVPLGDSTAHPGDSDDWNTESASEPNIISEIGSYQSPIEVVVIAPSEEPQLPQHPIPSHQPLHALPTQPNTNQPTQLTPLKAGIALLLFIVTAVIFYYILS